MQKSREVPIQRTIGAFVAPDLAQMIARVLREHGEKSPPKVDTRIAFLGAASTPNEIGRMFGEHQPSAVFVGPRWFPHISETRSLILESGYLDAAWIPIDLQPTPLMIAEAASLGLHPFLNLQLHDLDQFIVEASTAVTEAINKQAATIVDEIRIVSAFRGRILEHGLVSLLSPYPDINVVTSCTTPDELVTAVINHAPHLVVIGTQWVENWPLAHQQLLSKGIVLPHIAVVGSGATNEALRTDAENDFIYIDDTSLVSIVDVVRQIRHAARETVGTSPPSVSAVGISPLCHDDIDRQILQLLVTGASNQMIADEIYLSVQTVKNRLSRMMKATGTTNRTELAHHLHAA